MTRRNEKRRRARVEAKGYRELFAKLVPREQRIINEKVIQAVNELTNLEGQSRVGSKAFIEARAKQLILDMWREGLTVAGKRFRNAIARYKQRVARPPEAARIDTPPYADTTECHFVPEKPFVSTPNFGGWAGLEPDQRPLEAG